MRRQKGLKQISRSVLLALGTIFLGIQTWNLVSGLASGSPQDFKWYFDLLFAFLLNLFGTGVFALVGFAFPTNRLIPKGYYSIKSSGNLKAFYNLMGVPYFQKALMTAFWGKEKNRKKYFDGTKSGIRNFIYQTKQSEFGHLGALVLISGISFFLVGHGYYLIATIAMGINFIGNLYPIILQRHHRMRLRRFY